MKIPVQQIDLNALIGELNALNQSCHQLKEKCGYDENDARCMIFLLLSMEIQYLLLGITLSKNLKNVEFYKENGYKTEDINEQFLENSIYQFINSLANSYFISMFVQLENYLRLIANHCAIDNFKISTTISNLNNKFVISAANLSLLKIIINLRNSMHNGGFFNHETTNIEYKEKQYTFTKGEPILYGGIPFFIFATKELLDFILELNTNSAEEKFIEHNYSKLVFELDEE